MSPRSEPALLSLPHVVIGWEWLLEARLWSKAWGGFQSSRAGPSVSYASCSGRSKRA